MEPDLIQFRRLARVKAPKRTPLPTLGADLVSFFKQNVARRQTKFSPIAECWSQLVPQILLEHTALESLSKGTLTVLVDSSSHLFELKQLLLVSLQRQLIVACRSSGLKKIVLKQGRWYEGDSVNERRLKF